MKMKKRLSNYLFAILFILVAPCLLLDTLQDMLEEEHPNDRFDLTILVTASIMTTIYSFGLAYIVGFCIQGAGL